MLVYVFCLFTFISFAGTVYELLSKRGSLAPGQDWSLFVCFCFYSFVCLFARFVSACPQEGVWHPDKIVVKSDDPLQVEKSIIQCD